MQTWLKYCRFRWCVALLLGVAGGVVSAQSSGDSASTSTGSISLAPVLREEPTVVELAPVLKDDQPTTPTPRPTATPTPRPTATPTPEPTPIATPTPKPEPTPTPEPMSPAMITPQPPSESTNPAATTTELQLMRIGNEHLDKREFELAAFVLNKILENGKNPELRAEAFVKLARAQSELRQFDLALEQWANLATENPEAYRQPEYLIEHAYLFLAVGRVEPADALLLEADALDVEHPERPDSLLARALAAELRGDVDSCRLMLTNLVRRYPASPQAPLARMRLDIVSRPIVQ